MNRETKHLIEEIEELLENDEITSEEYGFMQGYIAS